LCFGGHHSVFCWNLLCTFSYASITQNLGPQGFSLQANQEASSSSVDKREHHFTEAHAFLDDSFQI
jgi:hypothetical protein